METDNERENAMLDRENQVTPQEIEDEALAFVDEETRLDTELGVKPQTTAERYMHLLARALRQSRQEAGELREALRTGIPIIEELLEGPYYDAGWQALKQMKAALSKYPGEKV